MRPVFRGDVPQDANNQPVVFSEYGHARDPLIDRIGDYCCYCETAMHSLVDVEHVVPKSPVPELELEWSNFLIACGTCNRIKSDWLFDDMKDVYWPDRDNTLRAFVYEQDEPPQVADHPDVDPDKAFETLDLTGLDRRPGHPNWSSRDRRWGKRLAAWGEALLAASALDAADSEEMRQVIIGWAKALGFWSVWYEVFFDDEDMCKRLVAAFPGTPANCFDANAEMVPRPGGEI